MVIPIFPNFKKLDISDRTEIEKYTSPYKPYSDFNFISMWGYMHTESEWCILNNNLVFKFVDYLDGKPFLTYIGKHRPVHTIQTLLEYSVNHGLPNSLSLVPEESIYHEIDTVKSAYAIQDDVDNYDYILDLKLVCNLEGHNFLVRRQQIRNFLKHRLDFSFRVIDHSKTTIKDEMINCFKSWVMEGSKEGWERELCALERILDQKDSGIVTFGVYYDNNLHGFTLTELIPNSHYVMAHYEKANVKIPGIFSYLRHAQCMYFYLLGYKYLNLQQDLGKPGLRLAKQLWRPDHMLKKYIISPKSQ